MWVKIDDEVFHVEDISVQLSISKHATIYLELNIENNQVKKVGLRKKLFS